MINKKKNTAFIVWAVVSSFITVLLVVATLVVTLYPFLYNTLNSVFGGERFTLVSGDPDKYIYYKADYPDKKQTLAAANALNEQICEEGFILLENKEKALPLKTEQKVTVFGRNSVDLVVGGAGSNSGSSSGEIKTIYSGLSAADFQVNPVMKSFYENSSVVRPAEPGMGSIVTGFPVAEVPASDYTDEVIKSWDDYSDAAIVVLSRIAGEGFDLPRTMFWNGKSYADPEWAGTQVIPGAESADSHYLELDKNEKDMLDLACDNFDKVIVLINSSAPIECGFLKDSKIDAAMWIGHPGNSGAQAVGKLLRGDISPSGRTVDTFAADFTKDPTWNNFGNNRVKDGNRGTLDGKARNAYSVDYEEGIYVGYRYYETRGYTEELAGNAGWYAENVVYPFGYGLSYTEFSWECNAVTPEGSALQSDGRIEVNVTVTNIGDMPGKDVVQLYYTSPYYDGQIEKAHVVLGDYVKTDLLAPGESRTFTLGIDVREMASYDFSDANGNGFKGYELDAGKYIVGIMRNAHEAEKTYEYTVENAGFKYETDDTTNNPVRNLFDDVSSHITTYLSRSDWNGTWPQTPTAADLAMTQEFVDSLTYKVNDKTTDPWYTEEKPSQAASELSYEDAEIKLYELYGKDYDDKEWDKLLDQLTVSQMQDLVSMGNYHTESILNISKPRTTDADGPMGFAIFMGDPTIYDTCYYASECVMGATWNVDLLYEFGVMIGNEGLIGNERGEGQRPYSGWYAPAMNIHRSQFGGRNFEYYSEDGLLSGRAAAAVVKGAKSKGVYTYCKHFALNEQETNRDTTGLITWANEQAMRELYFVPFEEAVKEGQTTAMMSAFNRIGTTWAGGNYNLLTSLLREEWGFRGMVITDFNLTPYMNLDQMVRAGGDLNLSPGKAITSDGSATALSSIRRATKNILYTVVNSNATNGLGEGVVFAYKMPYWEIVLIVVDCVIFAGLAAWGAVVLVKRSKNKKIAE